ncbi:MAG: LuxR C-terminal-related transcriptional regulator [Planctomycetota bacterium]
MSGDLDKALAANQQLFDFATKKNYTYAEAWSRYLRGLIHFYGNDLEKAIDCFGQAIEQKHVLHTRAVADSMAGLVFSFQAARQSDRAGESMQRFFEYADGLDDPANSTIAHSCNTRLLIMRGETQTAIDWLRRPPPPIENMVWWLEIPAVTHCRALLADGSEESFEKAETTLGELLQLNQDNHNTCQTIQMMPLLAMVYQKQGRLDEALTVLKQAVDLATPGRWIRPFVELGFPMADLLKRMIKKNIADDFIDKLLNAIDSVESEAVPDISDPDTPLPHPPVSPSPIPAPQPLVEPLTNREMEVLELLKRRLQTKEIAEQLFISTETVKSHLKNIYQKLDAGNRRKAVEKAKKLGII